MLKRKAKYFMTAVAALVVTVFTPGIANAATFPDNRCIVNLNCYIATVDDYSMYLNAKVSPGQCLKTFRSFHHYWNRTQVYQKVWSGGACLGTSRVVAPGEYFNNSATYFNAIGGHP